jgi:hypothetical protein
MLAGWIHRAYAALERPLSSVAARRGFSTTLLVLFLVLVAAIEVNRRVALPWGLEGRLPTNHFAAVDLVFGVVLFFEVVEMALGIGKSLTLAVGRQFVVFALILIRSAVKELGHLPEPLTWEAAEASVPTVLADAFGGLGVFALTGVYFWVVARRPRVSSGERDPGFIALKKAISLALIAFFAVIMVVDSWLFFAWDVPTRFFQTLYTSLVFGDVVLVMVSLRYTTSYHVVFRNSAFAVASVILRFALTAPSPWNAALGVVGALFAIGVVFVHQQVAPLLGDEVEELAAEGDTGEAPPSSSGRSSAPRAA